MRSVRAAYGKHGKALRWHIVVLAFDHGWNANKVASWLNSAPGADLIHHSTCYEILSIFEATGDVRTPVEGRCTRGGIVSDTDLEHLVIILDADPDLFLDEMRDIVFAHGGMYYSKKVLCRTLQRIGYTRVVLHELNVRRDLDEEAMFIDVYSQAPATCLVFVDETHAEPAKLNRRMGRGPRGSRPEVLRELFRDFRFSASGVLTLRAAASSLSPRNRTDFDL